MVKLTLMLKKLLVFIIFIALSNTTVLFSQQQDIFEDQRDGQIYNTIKIGTQTWFAENLAFKTSSESWAYNNDVSYIEKYGYLYTFEVAKNACPSGWHLPSDIEWSILIDFLGGENIAGGKMKETDTTHWISPNIGATNESGFTALPAGDRNIFDMYLNFGMSTFYWSSTRFKSSYAWGCRLYYDNTKAIRYNDYCTYGHSVRCIKD